MNSILIGWLFGILCHIVGARLLVPSCECGYKVRDTGDVFTHRIGQQFCLIDDAKQIVSNPRLDQFNSDWLINDYPIKADNYDFRKDRKFDTGNVEIRDGLLVLTQKGYTSNEAGARQPISIAGLASKSNSILHGVFSMKMKVEGATGGSVASFFWYHDDRSEIDIEAVTGGNSIVNNTINYTKHPSTYPNGDPIPGATLSAPFNENRLSQFHEYRFSSSHSQGVQFYLDNQPAHWDERSIPAEPGNLQVSLWSDNNKFWSGTASTTDVHMSIAWIIGFHNTTDARALKDYLGQCEKAGGPQKSSTICDVGFGQDISVWDQVKESCPAPRR